MQCINKAVGPRGSPTQANSSYRVCALPALCVPPQLLEIMNMINQDTCWYGFSLEDQLGLDDEVNSEIADRYTPRAAQLAVA